MSIHGLLSYASEGGTPQTLEPQIDLLRPVQIYQEVAALVPGGGKPDTSSTDLDLPRGCSHGAHE
jgi:hypothetical protein